MGPASTQCSTMGLMSMVSIRACLDTVLNYGADVYGEYGTCLDMVLNHGADVYGEYGACLDMVLSHETDVYGEYQGLCQQCLTMGLMSMVIKYEGLPQHGAQPQR